MENITVLNNRLDESNGTVEHVLEMKAKKTPWHLRFAPKAKGIIVSFVQNLLSPLTQKEGVRGGQLSAFFQSAAAVVVGIGLLVGSLSLLAEPVQTGPGGHNTVNVCAPVISSITVHDDGSAGLRVSVDFSHGWEMFTWLPPSVTGLSHWEWYGYIFRTTDAVLHNPLERGDFSETFSYFSSRWYTSDSSGRDVHFDYFVRGGPGGTRGTGGQYFSMRIKPEFYGLRHVRGEHYYTGDHYVNITLYVTDRDSKGKRMPVGKYNMHCWVSDSDGNGYYVPVYFGGEAFF